MDRQPSHPALQALRALRFSVEAHIYRAVKQAAERWETITDICTGRSSGDAIGRGHGARRPGAFSARRSCASIS
ncbi:hypothetical protein MPLA_290026 [Mesorhizobium sp. ORS 3359]|nr:hypothetical protein MPLA_290026 [Mesorhizobium sp. ORS 3359]